MHFHADATQSVRLIALEPVRCKTVIESRCRVGRKLTRIEAVSAAPPHGEALPD